MGALADRMRRAFSLMICVAAAAVTAAAESPFAGSVLAENLGRCPRPVSVE